MKKKSLIIALLGVATALLSVLEAKRRKRLGSDRADQRAIDDRGTNQVEALRIMENIRDNAFEGSEEKLALALGRPVEEIRDWATGHETIDADALMKARALAMLRRVEIE